MDIKFNAEEASRRIDLLLSDLLKNTDSIYWHEVLDNLHEISKRENRQFIAPDGNLQKRMRAFFDED